MPIAHLPPPLDPLVQYAKAKREKHWAWICVNCGKQFDQEPAGAFNFSDGFNDCKKRVRALLESSKVNQN